MAHINLPFRLILASGSWGRKWLLEQAGYSFDVKPSNIDEPTEARLGDCRHYVGELAWLKAEAVARHETERAGDRRGYSGLAARQGDRQAG